MHADPALIRCAKAHVSGEEWAVRTDLAAAYRAVAMFGWDDLVFTHISARVPGPGHHFLINPYGMMFEEITASSLVKIDLGGAKVMDSPFEINPAGFTIPSAVHEACEVQVRALAGGGELVPIPRPIVDGIRAASKVVLRQSGGMIAWPGILRKLDRADPSWST